MASSAIAWCFAQSVIYVSSLYILVPAKVRNLDKNASKHIKYRMRALAIATVVCLFGTFMMEQPRHSMYSVMLQGVSWYSTLIPLVSYFALFSGPVCQLAMMPGSSSINYKLGYWLDLRTLIVAPVSEELVFRGAMTAVMLPYFPESTLVLAVPMFFGVAHMHHAYLRIVRGEATVREAFVAAAFQTAYTTFFGILMMRCLLDTRNIFTVILIHSWCNLMGFPSVGALFDDNIELPQRLIVGMFYIVGIVVMSLGLVEQSAKDIFGHTVGYHHYL